jgi:DNA-binding protein HU-beta
MTVSKSEIIALVASQSGVDQREVRSVVNALLGQIETSLIAGEDVSLGGFGSFGLESPPDQADENRLRAKAGKVPKFRAGKALRDHLN